MAKYSNIDVKEIRVVLTQLVTEEFTTYDFITIWERLFPESHANYSSTGVGWRKVVGKQLSKFAVISKEIKSQKQKRNGAELWHLNHF